MNELLQKHGCSNVFSIPEGLKELMSDITREVLREQPEKIFEFIANYLSALLITREHGVMSLKILEDLCDCQPSIYDHLIAHGLPIAQAEEIAKVIKETIEEFQPSDGNETLREAEMVRRVLATHVFDEDTIAAICQISRNQYRDYWYRKKLLEKNLKTKPNEPWEIAAEHTLEIYKKTKPSFLELERATEKILAAYKGYHVRRNLLGHLKPKKIPGPKVDLPGPPLDVAASREINLGPLVELKVKEDNVGVMFEESVGKNLGLKYDPMKTITHVEDDQFLEDRRKESTEVHVQYMSEPRSQPRLSKLFSNNSDRAGQSCDTIFRQRPTSPKQRPPSPRRRRAESAPKISFCVESIKVIPYVEDPSIQDNDSDDVKDIDDSDIPEAIEPLEDTDAAAEVPEDIPDSATEE